MPPSEVTVSTTSSAPWSWQSWPRPSIDCWAPVEVSAWTSATAFTLPAFLMASSTAARVKVWPHGTSSFTSLPPQRPTMSAMRVPKTPFTPTMTVSPGSMTLTSAASIPAEPVPEMAMVNWFCVWKAVRSMAWTSFMMTRKAGSRWPISGVAMARSTRGLTMLGPGPRSRRWGGLSSAGNGAFMCCLRAKRVTAKRNEPA